jgi:hypothetical protein
MKNREDCLEHPIYFTHLFRILVPCQLADIKDQAGRTLSVSGLGALFFLVGRIVRGSKVVDMLSEEAIG